MITKPMDVLSNYGVRKTFQQKTAFITAVSAFLSRLHYSVRVEKGLQKHKGNTRSYSPCSARNIVIGDPVQAKFLITAHYDTGTWSPVTSVILPYRILLQMLFVFAMTVLMLIVSVGIGILAAFVAGNTDLSIPVAAVVLVLLCILLFVGTQNKHNANCNTSGVVALLEIAATLPENLRRGVCFVLFDKNNEGFIGSDCYCCNHKQDVANQFIINLDCVGDGDEMILFPTKALRNEKLYRDMMASICGRWGKKSIDLSRKRMAFYPSDHKKFPMGVCIAAFHRNKITGPYILHIHTNRDTILDETNINILRAALISLVGAAEK